MAIAGVGRNLPYQQKACQDNKSTDSSRFLGELTGAVKRAGVKEEDKTASSEIRSKIQELQEKILKGETQQSFQIGASSFTIKEWERFLNRFDDTEEDVMEQLKEAREKQKEEAKPDPAGDTAV